MMIKILSRMSNMTYYQAWSAWYNGTIKINQLSADEELKMLLREAVSYTHLTLPTILLV